MSSWCGRRTRHRNLARGLDRSVWVNMRGSLWKCSQLQCKLATTEEFRGLEIQNQLLDDMKPEFQELPGRRVYTDVEREGVPPADAERVPATPRAAEEEEDSVSAFIPTLPPVTSPPPSLPEIDSESQRSFPGAFQNESAAVPVPSDSPSHLDSTSQGSRHQSWSMPQDVLTRETGERVRSSQALAPVQPMSHQERSVRSHSSEDFIPERQSSNQARERTVESADELPTQRPRLENPACSVR